LPVSVL